MRKFWVICCSSWPRLSSPKETKWLPMSQTFSLVISIEAAPSSVQAYTTYMSYNLYIYIYIYTCSWHSSPSSIYMKTNPSVNQSFPQQNSIWEHDPRGSQGIWIKLPFRWIFVQRTYVPPMAMAAECDGCSGPRRLGEDFEGSRSLTKWVGRCSGLSGSLMMFRAHMSNSIRFHSSVVMWLKQS